MNLTQMITSVSALAGDESNVQFTTTQITVYLNWAIDEISRKLEHHQKQVTFTVLDTGIEGVGGVAMPADFKQELHVFWNEIPLTRMNYGDYYKDWSGQTDSGNATFYSVSGFGSTGARRVVFYPYQTMGRTGVNVRVIYTSQPVDLVATTDVPPLPPQCDEVICLYALARCKMQENDFQGYKLIKQDVDYKIMELTSLMDEADGFSYPVVRSDVNYVVRSDA